MVELFEEKYFEDDYIVKHGYVQGTCKIDWNEIEPMKKNLEEITAEDIIYMSNAVLRTLGHLEYSAASINPRDGDLPDNIRMTYINIPKNTILIYGASKNFDFHDHMEQILKYGDLYDVLYNVQSLIQKPMPFTHIIVGDTEFSDENPKIFFEYKYKGIRPHFKKGLWVHHLRESYNNIVNYYTVHQKGEEPYCLISDYWSNPKHVTEDDRGW